MNRSDSNKTELTEFQISAGGDSLPAEIHDCWNVIGVSGNASCRELQRFVHCRNCPVYSNAALQLLDRPITESYRQEWADHFGEVKKLSTPAKISVVIFRVASEWLALETAAFQEVAEHRPIHSLPHRRRGLVLGLANVRGELLICASLARLIGLDQPSVRSRSRTVYGRLLVSVWNGARTVFPVDEVHGIQRINYDQLRDPPSTVAKSMHTYTRGVFAWREATVGLLETETLFAALNRNLT